MMSLPHARYPRENIAAEPGMLPWWRTLQFTILSTNGKDSKRSSAQPCIALIESLQTFPGDESFQFQLNLKNEVFPYFFFVSLYVALWSIETLLISITSASHLFHFQPSEQTIFLSQSSRLGHGTRPQRQSIRSAPDQTTTTDNQMSLRSGHRSDHAPTLTSDYRQTRPPDQISPQTTIHGCSTSNQHSTPNLVKWYRSGALFVGWVKGGI